MKEPTLDNTLPKDAVIMERPIFARICSVAKIYGLSTSSVYNYLRQAKGMKKYEHLSISLGPSCRLIDLEKFKAFLIEQDNKWLTDGSRAKKAKMGD